MTPRDRMLSAMLAIGSAHAGEPLTRESLTERLKGDDFRRLFNGSPPAEVVFHNEETAAAAAAFENAGRRA